jgi:hypothetical protein
MELFGLLPEQWAAVVGAGLTLLIALRTVLRAFVAVLYAIDLALDGVYDWTWVGRLGDAVDRMDDLLDRLPVKAPFVKSRKD